jgi:DNA-binding SARP family transcriptional activator
LQVFGPLKAWRDGAEVPVAGTSRRALLGLLLLHPGKVVSRAAIAGVLWGGEPPATAATVIQLHVSRLRAVLDRGSLSGGRLIETAGDGYRLSADGVQIDLVQAHEQAAGARAAMQAGDAAGSCDRYQQALAMWQGQPPLADVPLLRGHPAVISLEQELGRLVVDYAEIASAHGWHDRVLAHLYALAERAPLNERSHACLMIALAGSGQQAAALELFERLWRRLDDQLGIRPGPILADAHMRVLRNEIPRAAFLDRGSRACRPRRCPCTRPRVLCEFPPAPADFTGRVAAGPAGEYGNQLTARR